MKHKKGSVLMIVLMLFTFISQGLLFFTNTTILSIHTSHQVKQLDTMRCMEVLIVGHFKDQIRNDVLLFDEFDFDNGSIYYTVDDMLSTFDIHVELIYLSYENTFTVKIDKSSGIVKSFNYT